jgi:osmotically-inducible protein OsmY
VSHQTELRDDELAQRIRLFLAGSNRFGLRNLSVEASTETVVVRGRVWTLYEKQVAMQFIRRVAGVFRVVDEITVRASESETDPKSP